jgi:general secretion pathway protein C
MTVKTLYRTALILAAITVMAYLSVDIFYTAAVARFLTVTPPAANSEKLPGSISEQKPPPDTYAPIVERNLFGSASTVTGEIQINVDELEPTQLDLELAGTVSGGGFDYAVIDERKKQKQGLFKVGDSVADASIIKILKSSVILRIGGRDEVLSMKDRYDAQPAQPEGTTAGTQSGDTITVKKEDVDHAFRNMNEMLAQVRVRPTFSEGKPGGFMVSRIRSGSFFEKMGLKNGDIIRGVNGKPLQSADRMLDLYRTMKSGSEVTLTVKRRGKDENLRYAFQ